MLLAHGNTIPPLETYRSIDAQLALELEQSSSRTVAQSTPQQDSHVEDFQGELANPYNNLVLSPAS
jgi:hypothetical protein